MTLDTPPARAHYTHDMDAQAAIQKALDRAPGSIRELAAEADLSEALLRAVRDGDRRCTPRTRDRLVDALRSWEETCGDVADALEAADLDHSTGGDR